MGIEFFNQQFIDSMQYMAGSLSSLASSYGLKLQKGKFAHSLNRPKNYCLGKLKWL